MNRASIAEARAVAGLWKTWFAETVLAGGAMSYSPLSSAFEGFRLIARRPVSFLGWCFAFGLAQAATSMIAIALRGPPVRVGELRVLNPGSNLIATLLAAADTFVVAAVVACAVYRAVLRPKDRGLAYLRLGGGELRVMGVWLVLGLFVGLALILLGLSFTVLSSLLGSVGGPWAAALPGLALLVAIAALGTRLSLAGPIALVEGRHSLAGSWDLSKDRFWSLLGLWAILLFASLLLGIASQAVGAALGAPAPVLQMMGMALSRSPATQAVWLLTLAVAVLRTTVQTVLGAAAAAAVYRGLTAPAETPVDVFD